MPSLSTKPTLCICSVPVPFRFAHVFTCCFVDSIAMSLCPWTSCTEWNDVLELLYSSETEHRRKGLARVGVFTFCFRIFCTCTLLVLSRQYSVLVRCRWRPGRHVE